MRGRKPKRLTEQEKEYQQKKRRIQNRINKRNQRLRDNIRRNIPITLSKELQQEEYIKNLITYFNTYNFDIHFTGTFEPQNTNRISLQSLRSYTDRYIQMLIDNGLIEYGLIFLDTGENENNHTHILMKTNSKVKNIHSILKKSWLLGHNIKLIKIQTEEHKLNTIKYGFNKMGNTHRNKEVNIKIDLWNLIKN
jgi:hypothetical protein